MTEYDLVVIGAGIHGAGVAQAAAAKGLSVLVIERREAAGMETSRASSKLIHGGLRYLETFQVRLVYECLREQRNLLRNAPHYVAPLPTTVPIFDIFSGLANGIVRFLGLTRRPSRYNEGHYPPALEGLRCE